MDVHVISSINPALISGVASSPPPISGPGLSRFRTATTHRWQRETGNALSSSYAAPLERKGGCHVDGE